MARANDKSRAALERDVVAKLQEFVKNGALIFQHGLVVATARR